MGCMFFSIFLCKFKKNQYHNQNKTSHNRGYIWCRLIPLCEGIQLSYDVVSISQFMTLKDISTYLVPTGSSKNFQVEIIHVVDVAVYQIPFDVLSVSGLSMRYGETLADLHHRGASWRHQIIFRVTVPLCGFTGDRWIPLTKASDAELWCFLWTASE